MINEFLPRYHACFEMFTFVYNSVLIHVSFLPSFLFLASSFAHLYLFVSVFFLFFCFCFFDSSFIPLLYTMSAASNSTSAEYFSMTYAEAREKFLKAAEAAGAKEIEQHVICHVDGQDYFLDTAFFPGKDSKKLLVHSSGTHGVEGYTGSAIQTKLLRSWSPSNQEGPSVLFVHAINPYGMAQYRRFNENNVDLNRNYLSQEQWAAVKSRDPNAGGYETFRHVLSPSRAPTWGDKYWFYATFGWAVLRHGFVALKRAFVTGQYHHPEGIYYGGEGEQPSVTTLRKVLNKYSDNGTLADAIFIDVHSGLGPAGIDTIMTSNAGDAERAQKVFINTKVQNDAGSEDGPSGGYNLAAGIIRPRVELAGDRTLSVTEEFGTVPPLQVGRAIIMENAAYHYCKDTEMHQKLRMDVLHAFYPQNEGYMSSVIKLGTDAFNNALRNLQ